MRRAACALGAACFSLAGCTGGSSHLAPAPTTDGPSPSSAVLDCVNGMGTTLRGRDVQPVLGVVALPASPAAAALGTGRLEEPGLPRLFAKSALLIRAGSSFVLRVSPASPSSFGFSWSPHQQNESPTRTLVVRRCRSSATSTWLAFIGGYYVDQASCVTLIVTTKTGARRVSIGVGTPCVGQRPPLGPPQG